MDMDETRDPIQRLREELSRKPLFSERNGYKPLDREPLLALLGEIEAAYVPREEHDERIEELEAQIEAEREEAAFWEAQSGRLCNVLDGMKYTHMKLPVDADGVPIRPGDNMQTAHGELARVVAVGIGKWAFYHSLADDEWRYDMCEAKSSRHAKLDTVESLLEEFERRYSLCLYVDYTGDDTPVGLREEYAERIRKAMEK